MGTHFTTFMAAFTLFDHTTRGWGWDRPLSIRCSTLDGSVFLQYLSLSAIFSDQSALALATTGSRQVSYPAYCFSFSV
jgi:hypothetical protein